jgi:predicted ATPase/DNA-binding CsgD family transcriptional regulator
MADGFSDGIAFVSLAPIRDPELVLPTIAQALGLHDSGDQRPLDRLQSYLRDQELLLFLDNFEQVVGAAPRVAELLVACSRLKMLVASRAVLHISGVQEYPVTPLALPDLKDLSALEALAQTPAVALFVQRALAVMPNFQLVAENATAVAEICVQLDGLPLAIELAAARIRLLPPRAILARLTEAPGTRLQLLSGGAQDLPARQQTLRDTISWSYSLLDPWEQTLFRQLSIFVGGFTLEDVEAVVKGHESVVNPSSRSSTAILDGLTQLRDQSLLISLASQGEHPTALPRFSMLETIGEYGLEQLRLCSELAVVRQAHAAVYLALAEEAEPHLAGPHQGRWLDRLEAEHDNLRAALHWSLERDDEALVLRLSGALWWFWYRRGYWSEGRHWLQQALTRQSADVKAGKTPPNPYERLQMAWRARALNGAGILAHYQDDYNQAATLSGASVALYRQLGDRRGLARALHGLALVARAGDNHAAVYAIYGESLALFRAVGNRSWTAYTLFYLGVAYWLEGDYDGADPLFQESLTIAQELQDRKAIAFGQFGLGQVALGRGDYAAARFHLEEGLPDNLEFGDQRTVSRFLYGLGDAAAGEEDYAAAYAHYTQCLALGQALGDRYFIIWCLEGVARVATAYGQPARAVQLFAASAALRDTLGIAQQPFRRATYAQVLATARGQLDAAAFAGAWAAGEAMALEQAVQFAMNQPTGSEAGASPPSDHRSAPPASGVVSEHPDSLTSRELDVLRLIATGLTDAQVAEALVVSPRTVNAHLRSIYSKLGLTSRSAATRYALEHGLLPRQAPTDK